MKELWAVYHQEIPAFLQKFAGTPAVQRLRRVGMNCGCEYTRFPRFAGLAPYSRFDHSVGVALIVWHFTGSVEQALAGLFHDITTPVFAHVVDFLNGDHLRQESTESGVEACLAADHGVMVLLDEYGLTLEQVSDYHRYPVADNDSPALSADRLEYTMGNLLNYGFAELGRLREFYADLTVGENGNGVPELCFRSERIAAEFARTALQTSRVYVADEDRFAMESLAVLLRTSVERGILTLEDLWTTEPEVIGKLANDPACRLLWQGFCGYSRILTSPVRPEEDGWVCVPVKKRYIDPMVLNRGRISELNEEIRREQRAFLELDVSCWLSGS